jgi:hypothetical protein
MRYAKVDPGVNPKEQITYIALHGFFNLFACFGFGLFFVIGLCSPRLRKNIVLLSFFAVFTLVCATNTMLLWTGYAFRDVPFSICVASGAFGSSTSLLQVAAALSLVLKVCIFRVCIDGISLHLIGLGTYDDAQQSSVGRATGYLIIRSCEPPLIWILPALISSQLAIVPWIIATPFFLVGAIMASLDYDRVSRASPLYCAFHLDAL